MLRAACIRLAVLCNNRPDRARTAGTHLPDPPPTAHGRMAGMGCATPSLPRLRQCSAARKAGVKMLAGGGRTLQAALCNSHDNNSKLAIHPSTAWTALAQRTARIGRRLRLVPQLGCHAQHKLQAAIRHQLCRRSRAGVCSRGRKHTCKQAPARLLAAPRRACHSLLAACHLPVLVSVMVAAASRCAASYRSVMRCQRVAGAGSGGAAAAAAAPSPAAAAAAMTPQLLLARPPAALVISPALLLLMLGRRAATAGRARSRQAVRVDAATDGPGIASIDFHGVR